MLFQNDSYSYHADSNTLINTQIQESFLKYSTNRKIEVKKVEVNDNKIRENLIDLKQVILELTQDCLLNCKYCMYSSGQYKYWQRRKGAKKSLTYGSAKSVIDYLWELIGNRSTKVFTIGFYGGEPLLAFQMIKKIVDYSRSVFMNWDIRFTITTNGLLLADSVTHYLIDNKFTVFVSLDGNRSNHDAKRVLKDGSGSFQTVYNNLERFKAINPDYFKKSVSFSIVYSKDLPLEGVVDFFNNDPLVKENYASLGFVNVHDSNYYKTYPINEEHFSKAYSTFLQGIVNRLIAGDKLSPIQQYVFDEWKLLNDSLSRRYFNCLMGACFFNSKFMVDVDGRFHICEKMNPKFSIGNTKTGFDIDFMKRFLSKYIEFIENSCSKCDIRYLCSRCYIHFAKKGTFEMNDSFCRHQKKAIRKALEYVIKINQFGGFDH